MITPREVPEVKPARGKALDAIAITMGLKRKRWFWIFRERDKTLRRRILIAYAMPRADFYLAGGDQ